MTDKPIIFRTPVVPSVNDTVDEIGEIASFIRSLYELRIKYGCSESEDAGIEFELLPFHQLASDKYKSLGLEYKARDMKPPGKDKMKELAEAANLHGLKVKY